MVAEQEGSQLWDAVRALHRDAAAIRAGDQDAADRLTARLRQAPDAALAPYIRACAMQLALSNTAEAPNEYAVAGSTTRARAASATPWPTPRSG